MSSDHYIDKKKVADFFGVSCSTVYRWARTGVLPRPEKIGMRTSRWKKSEIEEWKFKND